MTELKVTKNQGFTLSLEDTLFRKTTRGGVKLTRHCISRVRILRKTQMEFFFNFQISGQSAVNKNCHNSRKSNYVDIKLGPVTRLHKSNTAISKKIDDDVIFIFVLHSH